eukprot:764772-Hanusia_phi.AAC.2
MELISLCLQAPLLLIYFLSSRPDSMLIFVHVSCTRILSPVHPLAVPGTVLGKSAIKTGTSFLRQVEASENVASLAE